MVFNPMGPRRIERANQKRKPPVFKLKNMNQQRVIRFRAWDIDNERMVDSPFYFEPKVWPDDEKAHNEPMWRFFEDWQDWEDGRERLGFIMQSTGLKDKEGVEIYQNDIVTFNGHGPCEVVWNPDKLGWSRYWRNTFYELTAEFSEDLQIIGNRYANPDPLHT
jgi:hypothetical protein